MSRLSMLALPLLVSCSEYAVNGTGADGTGGVPDIAVDPVEVDFGSISQGSEVTRSVRISNRGTVDLEVDSLTIAGSSAYTVADPDVTLIVEPGASSIHEVRWTPTDEIDEGALRIASNDLDTPELDVPLLGNGLFGELTITPDPLTFEEIVIGCSTTSPLELRNDGLGPITIQELSLTGTGFRLDTTPEWPLLLEPGSSAIAEVTFEPAVDGGMTGTVAADSTDRRGLRTSGLEASAVGPAHVVDEFKQASGYQIDLMFFIDSSCSMTDDAENLAANFELFLDELLDGGIDYNVMVVTDADGCHNVELITPYTIDAIQTFSDATKGTGGAYSEAGLVVTSLALAQTGLGACNEGFIRVGVPVVTVMVSDEPDFSPGSWIDQVLAMQASAPDIVVNGVIGQIGNTCGANNGAGYHEAVAATGGVDLDICDADWGTYVSEILGTADLLSSFALTAVPNTDTLVVTVEGAPAVGWSWNETKNQIEFDVAQIPPENATILVEYDEAVTCP